MRMTVPLIGPGVPDRSVQVNGQRTVNLYPVYAGRGAKNPVALYSTPGLKSELTTGTGPQRANHSVWEGKMYVVSGNELYSVDRNKTSTLIGTLSSSSGRVSMVAGRDYLMLVDAVAGYTYDGTTFATISDADFPANPSHVTYLDGYFIVNKAGSDQFYISSNEDPTSWAALDFASAESHPDNIVAHIATQRDLYLMGTETTQVYYNSGNADFPFDVYPNGVLEWGIAAKHSLCEMEGRLYLLGRTDSGSRVVLEISGFEHRIISDQAVNWLLAEQSSVADAVGFAYRQAGTGFYVLTLPTADKTLVFDVEQRQWHERKTYDIGRWRAHTHGFFDETHWVGSYATGEIYSLDFATYTDDGAAIERIRQMQVLHRDRRRIIVHELEVEFESGVGLTTGQGSDPQVILQYSRDGGRRWSNELWRSLGAKGEYEARAVWRQLGEGRQWEARLTVTDPVKTVMVSAYADIEVVGA